MVVNAVSFLHRVSQITKNDTYKSKTLRINIRVLATSILKHLNCGQLKKAVSLLFSCPSPLPTSIYAHLFRACASQRALVEAHKLESHILANFRPPSIFLLNRAIDTYAKCGSLVHARKLFDEMAERDVGTWNAMITSYTKAGLAKDALLLFSRMNSLGIVANEITFASVMGSCGAQLALFLAKQIHGLVIKFGFCWNVILGSSIVNVYGKCSAISDAHKMFNELSAPNEVSWNVIIRRFLEARKGEAAVAMFFQMIRENVRSLNFTFSNALIACIDIGAFECGRQIHGISIKIAFDKDDIISTSLIDMYVKFGYLEDAHRLFDQLSSRDVVSWTSIMSGYAICGRICDAQKLFNNMPERNVVSWNAMLAGYTRLFLWDEALHFVFWMRKQTKTIDQVTLALILNVCAGLSDLGLGKQVHGFIYRHDYVYNVVVGNALLNMYGKCGNLRNAGNCFLTMGHLRDNISWNALISGYTRHRQSEEALQIFKEMQWETTPSDYTFSSIFAACANIFTLDQGKEIHGYMIRHGFETDIVTKSALVDMYSKCRCLEYSIKVFRAAGSGDLVIWNSMILGSAYNGRGSYAFELFESMEGEGIKPDSITFVGVLLSCIGEGLVDLGEKYFDLMSEQYLLSPRIEHYECMIELFSRHGMMDGLEKFVHKMPFEPTLSMWMRIFDACRDHGNSRLGHWAAECINKINPSNPVCFQIPLEAG